MSSKRNSGRSKKPPSTNQSTISKFFLSQTEYPTCTIRKRAKPIINAASPSTKVPKLQLISDEPGSLESVSDILNSFSYTQHRKCEGSEAVTSKDSPNVDEEFISKTFEAGHNHISLECDESGSNALKEKIRYTPLEKQYLELKCQNPNTILLIECGYKYRFFGEDAEIASKVLNIACFKNHNFMGAIIPVPRLCFHVKKLVLSGYKVGVVKQTESAALKAIGNSRNELFSRKLDALYTKSTLVGEEFLTPDSEDASESIDICESDMGSGYLMCVYEKPCEKNSNNQFQIAVVAVQISSGDVTYASFCDFSLRNKLENCLFHLNPSEILVPPTLSKTTENLITSFSHESNARVEKMDQRAFDHSVALENVSKFYTSDISDSPQTDLQRILSLPELITSCVSALISYLSDFKLENILKNLRNFQSLSSGQHMCLSAATLKGLDILSNSSSNTEHGSLLWVLNKTCTAFGERLLKCWISKPLTDLEMIEERLNIVTEIIHSESIVFKVIEKTLNSKLPDLERILCSAFYQKCSCNDLLKLLQTMNTIRSEFFGIEDKISEVQVPRLKCMLSDVLLLLQDVEFFLNNLDFEAARNGDKTRVFRDTSKYPDFKKCLHQISELEQQLQDLRPEISKTLKMLNFKYNTVSGQKYLIEVPNDHMRLVPDDWLKFSSTKQVSRFRSPEVIRLCNELELQKELLIGYANEAWTLYLEAFQSNFYKYKRAITHLGEMDCYFSLAKVAKEENYSRPQIKDTADRSFCIIQGRHPILLKAMENEENQFVANDLSMDSTCYCMIVTGPNMGGKSTYVRQTALIVIMAQMGSYVPAELAIVPLFDNIHVRMGADDDLINRKSSFMAEMSETSEILANSTSKSFVILDELGRGTSTNDGAAIAYATLEHLITEICCFSLFVTHYPAIIKLKEIYPFTVNTVHMGYILKDNDDTDIEIVTFLYNVVPGTSEKSYGINVAALAGIPKPLLLEAQQISQEIELKGIVQRKMKSLLVKLQNSTKLQGSSTESSFKESNT